MNNDKSMENINKLDGKVPVGKAIPFGLQHILAMFVANIAPILIVAGASGLSATQTTNLVQCARMSAGIGSLIQLFPLWKIGSGLPIVMGISFTFVSIFCVIGPEYGYGSVVGAVLVGVNFAKAAAYAMGLPLVPVHHIRGHIAANYLAYPELEPPFICLVVSGGHTLIVDVRGYTDFRILGTTRDDAAGECFDKVARVLGMPYPGGAALDRCAKTGDEEKYPLPHTKLSGNPLDMSFSGLKTAALNLIHMHEQKGESVDVPSLCASFSKAVSEMLVPRTMQAVKEGGYRKLAIAGGVAANSRIRADFKTACEKLGAPLYTPPLSLCGDNGAMIGSQGYYEFLAGTRAGQNLNAFATRSIEQSYE